MPEQKRCRRVEFEFDNTTAWLNLGAGVEIKPEGVQKFLAAWP